MIPTTEQIFTFLGGGVVVFLLEQLFRYLRRKRVVLGYLIDTRPLAERTDPDLKILYKNHDVQKVCSHRIILKNMGNTSLTQVPVFITPASGRLLTCSITASPGIHCPIAEGEPPLAFTFDLLNPGEIIDVSIVVLDSTNDSIAIGARAQDLHVRQISSAETTSSLLKILAEAAPGPFARGLVKALELTLGSRL